MANNRMVLVCNACNPDEWQYYKEDGSRNESVAVIGKWYPGGDYSLVSYGRDTDGRVDKFLEDHGHVGTEYEEYPVRLEYEVPPGPRITQDELDQIKRDFDDGKGYRDPKGQS